MNKNLKFWGMMALVTVMMVPGAARAEDLPKTGRVELSLEQVVGNFTNPDFPYQSAVGLLMGWIMNTMNSEIQQQSGLLKELQQQGKDPKQIEAQTKRLALLRNKQQMINMTLGEVIRKMNIATNGLPPEKAAA